MSVDFKQYDGIAHEFFGLVGAVAKAKEAVQQVADGLHQVLENMTKTSAAS